MCLNHQHAVMLVSLVNIWNTYLTSHDEHVAS